MKILMVGSNKYSLTIAGAIGQEITEKKTKNKIK